MATTAPPARRVQGRGFTLIELLVVIAIPARTSGDGSTRPLSGRKRRRDVALQTGLRRVYKSRTSPTAQLNACLLKWSV